MKNTTRKVFNQYLADQAELNGVDNAAQQFTVDPNVEQRIVDETQASSAFLQLINVIMVDPQKGQSLGLSVSPNASTTDTTTKDRDAKNIIDSHNIDDYFCTQTNFDVAIPYALLDAWAHRKEFQTIMAKRLVQQMAIDKVTIGFNGKTRALTSNRATNPLGQDVNIGWLEKVRGKSVRCMTGVEYGDAKEYKNIDAIVMDAVASLLDPWYRASPDIVAICSPSTAMLKYFDVVNRTQDSMNKEASERLLSQQHFGMRNIVLAEQCPDHTILVTSLDNLSIYTQNGSTRKTIIDNAKRDRVETYQSQNDAYVIEDFGKCGLIELASSTPAG